MCRDARIQQRREHDLQLLQEGREAGAGTAGAQRRKRWVGPALRFAVAIVADKDSEYALDVPQPAVLDFAQANGFEDWREAKIAVQVLETLPLGVIAGLETGEHPCFALRIGEPADDP